jgi:hypothetical protein
MQTKHLFLLPALAFLACAGLHAQVTIGSADFPKSGAILDLNSTAKGGLVLSNVSLTDPGNIPSDFPGVNGANEATLKAGMRGSMIYNTNANTCIGVHVWNGNYWERPAAEAPIKGAITLTMLSDPNTLFGGREVEFSATPGGKIYRWYASINNGPYEFVDLTTTHTLSKVFPSGSLNVKVIMDDCGSQKESDDVAFTPESLSPAFGSLEGKNIIYIYGDFDYAAASDYVPGGLVAHFDGINNRGLGDKQHDFTENASWKDLISGFDLLRGPGTGQWLSNGFRVDDNNLAFSSASFPSNFPAAGNPRTIEVIFRTPDVMFTQETDKNRRIFSYGGNEVSTNFGIMYRGLMANNFASADACGTENRWVFYAIFGVTAEPITCNLVTCLSSTPDLETPNTINTVTSTYANSMSDAQYTNSYINNFPATVLARGNTPLNTVQGPLQIGMNLPGSTFLSVRLYNRVLEGWEIEHNAALDQKRYVTPPEVTIDDKPCTEVVVLSSHFLMCRVPEGSSTGNKVVKLNGTPYSQYRYVDPDNDFYISSISPITGSAANGETLTFEGNLLSTITGVDVDGTPCSLISDPSEDNVKQYTLPPHAAGEVDIVVTTNTTSYRFAKVFEYQ